MHTQTISNGNITPRFRTIDIQIWCRDTSPLGKHGSVPMMIMMMMKLQMILPYLPEDIWKWQMKQFPLYVPWVTIERKDVEMSSTYSVLLTSLSHSIAVDIRNTHSDPSYSKLVIFPMLCTSLLDVWIFHYLSQNGEDTHRVTSPWGLWFSLIE